MEWIGAVRPSILGFPESRFQFWFPGLLIAMPQACVGYGGSPCVFSTAQPGKPVQPAWPKKQCVWCDLEALESFEASPDGQANLIHRLAVPWL